MHLGTRDQHCNMKNVETNVTLKTLKMLFLWRWAELDLPLLSWRHDFGPNLSSCFAHHPRCCSCNPPPGLLTPPCFLSHTCQESLPLCLNPEPVDDEDSRGWPPATPTPPRCTPPRSGRHQLRLPGPEEQYAFIKFNSFGVNVRLKWWRCNFLIDNF